MTDDFKTVMGFDRGALAHDLVLTPTDDPHVFKTNLWNILRDVTDTSKTSIDLLIGVEKV